MNDQTVAMAIPVVRPDAALPEEPRGRPAVEPFAGTGRRPGRRLLWS
ncbi:MAG: hypothetical protein MUE73_09390 [Planctomycetes bacterium]|jgi:hypothetical protein|nr:hypothetical protein [Planctomycetota bacterium]